MNKQKYFQIQQTTTRHINFATHGFSQNQQKTKKTIANQKQNKNPQRKIKTNNQTADKIQTQQNQSKPKAL